MESLSVSFISFLGEAAKERMEMEPYRFQHHFCSIVLIGWHVLSLKPKDPVTLEGPEGAGHPELCTFWRQVQEKALGLDAFSSAGPPIYHLRLVSSDLLLRASATACQRTQVTGSLNGCWSVVGPRELALCCKHTCPESCHPAPESDHVMGGGL